MSETSADFTLEDAHDYWNDIKQLRQSEIEELIEAFQNNITRGLSPMITDDELKLKQQKLAQSMLGRIKCEKLKDFPVSKTPDMGVTIFKELENEIILMKELQNNVKDRIEELNNEINYLENKKSGFVKMKEASSNAMEKAVINDYSKETAASKMLFQIVKNDLFKVVEKIFPDNDSFQVLLGTITKAYTKAGDDVFVDVTEENYIYAKFMVEADMAMFHRNDESRIKLLTL